MKRRQDISTIARLFVRSSGARLLLGAFLATCTVCAGIALLATSGWFITATGIAGLSAAALTFNVFVPSAAIRLLALLRTFGRYAERIVTHDATFAVLVSLRTNLFRGWAAPRTARALLQRPARLLFRLTNDVDALEAIYLRLVVPALAAAGAALLAWALLALLDWRLALALLVWLVSCGVGIASITARRAQPLSLRRALALERLRAQAIDLVAGQAELALAGQLPATCAALARCDARLARADAALQRLEVASGWATSMAGHIAVGGVLLGVGLLAERAAIDAPAAALAVLTALAAFEPFAALRRGALELARSLLAARRLAPRLRAVPAVLVKPAASDSHALLLDAVSVRHDGRRHAALESITLQIARGERVAVIGASGAGKSTLLSLAAGELAASSGRIAISDCSWLTQRTELFQDSLRDNLRLAAPAASDALLWDALAAAGLDQQVSSMTRALDTPLGEGGLGLSGGQARRLALARLLLRGADCWLLDEPTEGLDGATASDVLCRLARHALGHTVIIATHLRREAELAERLLVLEQGQLKADLRRGSPEFNAALSALRQH